MKVRIRFFGGRSREIDNVVEVSDTYKVGTVDDTKSALKVMTKNSSHVFLLDNVISFELLDQVATSEG